MNKNINNTNNTNNTAYISSTQDFVKINGNINADVMKSIHLMSYEIIPQALNVLLQDLDYFPYIKEYLETVSSENGYSNVNDYCQDDIRSTFDELYWLYPQEMSHLLVEILDNENKESGR